MDFSILMFIFVVVALIAAMSFAAKSLRGYGGNQGSFGPRGGYTDVDMEPIVAEPIIVETFVEVLDPGPIEFNDPTTPFQDPSPNFDNPSGTDSFEPGNSFDSGFDSQSSFDSGGSFDTDN